MKKLLLFALFALATAKVRYDGNAVWRIHHTSQDHISLIEETVRTHNLDVWAKGLGFIDIRLTATQQSLVKVALNKASVSYDVMIPNLQALIESEEERMASKPRAYSSSDYNTLTDIYARLDEVAAGNTNAVVVPVGELTYEGREIRQIQFSIDAIPGSKPVVWFDCGIHAREWITPATCMYGVDRFADGETEFMALLNTYDVHIIPVNNPDGYEYTFTDERMHRKNRRPNTDVGSSCVGTDLNRNFDFQWAGPGSSALPCADTYHGPSPASEVETQAVQNALCGAGARSYAAVYSIHAYSQMWMYAYGYTTVDTPDEDALYANAEVGVQALTAVYGTRYTYGSIADTIYEASGNTVDYSYGACGITYSYTLELRDTGEYGFLLPAEQILPTGEETWVGINAAIRAM